MQGRVDTGTGSVYDQMLTSVQPSNLQPVASLCPPWADPKAIDTHTFSQTQGYRPRKKLQLQTLL